MVTRQPEPDVHSVRTEDQTPRLHQADTDRLRDRIRSLENQVAGIQHQLAYRLGLAMVTSVRTPTGWLKMPFALWKAYRGYQEDKRKAAREIEAKQRNAGVQAKTRPAGATIEPWPEPTRNLLWQAEKLGDTYGLDHAIAYFRAHQDDTNGPALNILKANNATSDEDWLQCVNSYLAQFEISPIRLEPGPSTRFHRLEAPQLQPVESSSLVSVIMPVFNAGKTIAHSLRSILRQTWQDLEVIVVDDCSADETWSIAQEIAAADSRVTLIRNRINVGPYVSKNRGVDVAKGEWITGHDSDDWAHPQRIEKQMAEVLARPHCKVAVGQMMRMNESGVFTHLSKVGKTSDDGVLRVASISCIFEADFFRRHLGHWDSVRFGADSEMIERCRTIFSGHFASCRVMTMFCLDGEDSLTNHPVDGVSKQTGVSPSRQYYRSQWSAWHRTLQPSTAYLEFPLAERRFDAPHKAVVSYGAVLELLSEDSGPG